jgi:iron complex transport system ATP-binding protein
MVKLEMQGITLAYGDKKVVEDVTFQVMPGEMVGLVGPNGSGKSTIIKALSRVITPYSGRVLINGRDISQIPRRELSLLIGVVPQIPLLPSPFTAFEIVLMGRNPHLGLFQYEGPKDMDIVWQAMGQTSTRCLAERRISELSGGEIQCVVIARALAQETRAILLDEPTANLDIGRQIEILDLVKSLCRGNKLTVIAALHDLNLASHYCDRLFLINKGRIHAEGTPIEVINTENIEQVYGYGSYVHTHPLSGLPAVLPRVDRNRNSSLKKYR